MNPERRRELYARLRAANPSPRTELVYRTPYQLLVAVVLSAQATDKSVNLATARLFEVAGTPCTDRRARGRRAGGPHPHHRAVSHQGEERGRAVADPARGARRRSAGQGARRSRALPGVGRKTANVVLNTAFGEPTVAVDTHIFRVANRTGLAPGKDPLAVELKLLKLTPPEFLRDAHHWLILHGRYVCLARKPRCAGCIIRDLCEFKGKSRDV